ncbi:conserved hypothetical protein [Leishmania major strain Friedlin]|uniref:Uncharacterized protein n=1 Tax=Leishmania major TaxID=5664 RepID=E9AFX8_LEIMA|nr:conserved hypothetical protein [Leishmania major strain Friedlin]CAG9582861.1 hypothetical_protein_-_conserved [Leishmania major strain Friedlin]CBZ13133.1 conserved hypothetical protein [Leishmania major strain Friedlin]|eukprot:XP_003722898.1 conserved hypothetical protein [Leishmania major strain Friedlin]
MEVVPNGHEAEVDAALGFRRFPNAPHMTHTVFRPSKNLTATFTTAASSSALGVHNTYQTLTPNALANLRVHRGLRVDDFPSRPHTPQDAKSATSLPPLLPADRLSVGSSDGLRERGTEVFREWVKAPTNSSTSSPNGAEGGDADAAAINGNAHGSLELVSTSAPAASRGTESGQSCTSALVPPATLVPAKTAFASSDHCPSVSVSPESLRLVRPKSSTASFTPLQAPEVSSAPTVDAALYRLRDVLMQAQRVLDKSQISGDARALPAPPAMPPEPAESAQHEQQTAVLLAQTSTGSPANEDVMPEDSLDCVSPLASTHAALYALSEAERRVGVPGAASPTFAAAKVADNVAVPDETRFMVLCAVSQPSAIMERRLRRRGPATRAPMEGLTSPPAHSLFGACAETGAMRTSSRRIAEVPSASAAVSASTVAQLTTAAGQLQRSSSPNAGGGEHPSLRAPAQRGSAEGSVSRHVHEDPSLIPGLAEFLRAGNPNSFTSLSAATHAAPPARAKASPSTRRPRRRSGPPAAADPSPAVLLGHSPSLLQRRGSSGTALSQADRAVTPSLHLPYAHTEGSATVADVSPRRGSARARRVDSTPSYAQPTLSWLSKGSEVSADQFPMSRVASPQTSPLKDPVTASRDAAPSEPALL